MLRENAAEWRKQWVHQGVIQGRLEGKLEGERLLLTRLLTRRYAELPSWALQKLEQATVAELEQISDAMFEVTNLEQLFEPR